MTRLIAIWTSMNLAVRTYSIALPLSVLLINMPWLIAWLPTEAKNAVEALCYYIWMSLIAFIVPWVHYALESSKPKLPEQPPKV